MHHITSKREFYALSRKLLLGNILRQWDWEEFKERYLYGIYTLPEVVGVRHIRRAFTNEGNSGLYTLKDAYTYGLNAADRENLLFDEGAVHDKLTIQGEVTTSERGLELRYSRLKCHQRTLWELDRTGSLDGLSKHQLPHNWKEYFIHSGDIWDGADQADLGEQKRPIVEYLTGLRASTMLREYMDADAWECLNEILSCQRGPENSWGDEIRNFVYPIVEFACFDSPIGVLGWKVLFWEVRTCY